MGLEYSPKITTTGFHIYVDPKDLNCYPGSGLSVYDLSGNGKTMTLQNGASVVDGNFVLDGSNDYINHSMGSFDWTAIPWTVMFWAKPTDFTYPSVLELMVAGNGHFRFDMNSEDIRIQFRPPAGNSTTLVSHPTVITLSEWYHCAFTRVDNTFTAYLNGGLGTTNVNTNFIYSPNMTQIRIGYSSDYDAADRTFEGSVGPLMIYERALSLDEISKNYNSQKSRFGL